MIPELQTIQANVALGLITEREAEELCFLIKLVNRDYQLSASEPTGVDSEAAEPNTETEMQRK